MSMTHSTHTHTATELGKRPVRPVSRPTCAVLKSNVAIWRCVSHVSASPVSVRRRGLQASACVWRQWFIPLPDPGSYNNLVLELAQVGDDAGCRGNGTLTGKRKFTLSPFDKWTRSTLSVSVPRSNRDKIRRPFYNLPHSRRTEMIRFWQTAEKVTHVMLPFI